MVVAQGGMTQILSNAVILAYLDSRE